MLPQSYPFLVLPRILLRVVVVIIIRDLAPIPIRIATNVLVWAISQIMITFVAIIIYDMTLANVYG